jgi:hypothetical protein
MARTTKSIISFETQRVASGKRAATQRSKSVLIQRPGLVSQTILSRGGTFRRAWNRSRHVCGVPAVFAGAGLMPGRSDR